jgi:hypothetical protein
MHLTLLLRQRKRKWRLSPNRIIRSQPVENSVGIAVNILGYNGVEKFTTAIQSFGKWFFDLLLNAAIVAGLLLAAKDTNNMAIKTLAYAAWAIFFIYVGSFFVHFRLDLFDWVKDLRLRGALELASGIIVAVIIAASLNLMFQKIISAAVSAIELSK